MLRELFPHIRSIDREFARYISEQGAHELVAAAAALTSFALSQGNVCIHLKTVHVDELWPELSGDVLPELPADRENWIKVVTESPLVGDGNSSSLMVLREDRLYFFRYFRYEQSVAVRIRKGMVEQSQKEFTHDTKSLMKRLFATDTDFSDFGGDLQLAGSLLPLFFPFTVLSGGPGTGKTTTVTKLLALLLSQNPDLSIALAAPTGKAAQRMNESIRGSVKSLGLPDEICGKLYELEAGTIHRLLGVRHLSPSFDKNSENPLSADLLVVDEASMIDLPLLAKLLDAVPHESSVILLGDQFQLASVEAGSVLGDICAALPNNSFSGSFRELHAQFSKKKNQVAEADLFSLFSPVIQLTRSFRFDPYGGVGRVSRLINEGAVSIAADLDKPDGAVVLVPEISISKKVALSKELRASNSAEEALNNIPKAMILTLLNEGPAGQNGVNTAILAALNKKGDAYVHNMPIMVTENNYDLSLFNGDMGVIRREGKGWFAFFPGDDPQSVRQLPVVLLPQWQPAFAITIHKSQGSEYTRLMILLGEGDCPLLTRELIYTAITRVKPLKGEEARSVLIEGTPEQLAMGIARKVKRRSGLRESLQGS